MVRELGELDFTAAGLDRWDDARSRAREVLRCAREPQHAAALPLPLLHSAALAVLPVSHEVSSAAPEIQVRAALLLGCHKARTAGAAEDAEQRELDRVLIRVALNRPRRQPIAALGSRRAADVRSGDPHRAVYLESGFEHAMQCDCEPPLIENNRHLDSSASDLGEAMKARKRKRASSLTTLMSELTFASWETIARRSIMMAQGTCSLAEYQRMIAEKVDAAAASSAILISGGGRAPIAAVLAPWRSRARANARRLRRK